MHTFCHPAQPHTESASLYTKKPQMPASHLGSAPMVLHLNSQLELRALHPQPPYLSLPLLMWSLSFPCSDPTHHNHRSAPGEATPAPQIRPTSLRIHPALPLIQGLSPCWSHLLISSYGRYCSSLSQAGLSLSSEVNHCPYTVPADNGTLWTETWTPIYFLPSPGPIFHHLIPNTYCINYFSIWKMINQLPLLNYFNLYSADKKNETQRG